MQKVVGYLSFIISLLLVSCEGQEVFTIDDNTAPPDGTISNAVVETYANKVYIALIGRDATTIEIEVAANLLKQNNLSEEDRTAFVNSVLAKPDYINKIVDFESDNLILGIDTNTINEDIQIFMIQRMEPTLMYAWDLLDIEIRRLKELKAIYNDANNDLISIAGIHRRLLNNFYYDQINMGSENFVVSAFESLYLRYPSQSELETGVNMVDGQNAVLFLKSGDSKDDFLDIFLDTDNYKESLVRSLFLRYLFREPSPEEILFYVKRFKDTNDFAALQRDILILDEYVGL